MAQPNVAATACQENVDTVPVPPTEVQNTTESEKLPAQTRRKRARRESVPSAEGPVFNISRNGRMWSVKFSSPTSKGLQRMDASGEGKLPTWISELDEFGEIIDVDQE